MVRSTLTVRQKFKDLRMHLLKSYCNSDLEQNHFSYFSSYFMDISLHVWLPFIFFSLPGFSWLYFWITSFSAFVVLRNWGLLRHVERNQLLTLITWAVQKQRGIQCSNILTMTKERGWWLFLQDYKFFVEMIT